MLTYYYSVFFNMIDNIFFDIHQCPQLILPMLHVLGNLNLNSDLFIKLDNCVDAKTYIENTFNKININSDRKS